MNTIIITVECTVIITLLVLLMGFLYETQANDRKTKLFIGCLISAIYALAFDAASYILDGYPDIYVLQFIINLIATISGSIVILIFIFYEIELLNIKKKISKWYTYVGILFTTGFDIALIVLMFAGKLYNYVNNVFELGDAYVIYVISQIVSGCYLLLIVLINHKNISHHDLNALLFYLLLPIINAIIEAVVPGFGLSYAAAGISLLIVYVMLQSGKVEDSRIREELFKEFGYNDTLTGLPNRRSYDLLLDNMLDVPVGVIFCDVNGLKYTNDKYGHKAGDDLIVKLSDMLKNNFDLDGIYRISGDEFVVVIKNIEAQEFFDKANALREENKLSDYITSIGQIYGDGKDIRTLIIEAEDFMYKDKAEFHKTHPELVRK